MNIPYRLFLVNVVIVILGYYFDSSSAKHFKAFITECRDHLKSKSNLLWVALQSNQLADTSNIDDDFRKAFVVMKEDIRKNGWILPSLKSNMRNQINISNINVENFDGSIKMQSSISKLKSGTNVVGEIPILIKVKDETDWKENKEAILRYCIEEINRRDEKNTVVLFDSDYFKDVGNELKTIIKDKTIVSYPLEKQRGQNQPSIKDFIEKDNHILVTRKQYFNGCEASNIIFLNICSDGIRNCLLRGVKNAICIKLLLTSTSTGSRIRGMKEHDQF